mmetsp:Transcript_118466/g.184986  ORF Transcript_118466/g.184986 Transcript_118466/m.184986 type:complete len:360 (-) Transcript_118466:8-1087(-)
MRRQSINRSPSFDPQPVALMPRMHAVSQKADALLVNAGKTSSFREPAPGNYPSERLVDLTARLARLESLLDEVSHVYTVQPSTARFDNRARLSQATRALSFPSNDIGYIVAPPPPLANFHVHAPSPTPRSMGRFIEVASAPVLPLSIPPVAVMPMHGTLSPPMPMPPPSMRYGYGGNVVPQRVVSPPPPPPPPLYPGPQAYWQRGDATPRNSGLSTPRIGSRPIGLDIFGAIPPSNGEQLRSYSASRPQRVPPVALRTNSFRPPLVAPPSMPGASTPGLPSPPGLMTVPLGQISQNIVDTKIRHWLRSIPIGNGSDRGWDDAQISEIATFARDQNMEHLSAEAIYKTFVEHKVTTAGSS